ncbi:AAA family ATPase [Gottfriedia sp. NPDC057948]|uniref:AAA family ATPase n=1 Tax=Gottfriedia sp. NPDC057948 TaxID=3346287 RepID=UPI0036DB5D82
MFIRKIQIDSFRSIGDLEINFSQPSHNYFEELNLSILVGENGVGKSSIFQLLTSIFSPTQFKKSMERPICSVEYEINDDYVLYDSSGAYPTKYPSKMIVSSFSAFDPYDQWLAYSPGGWGDAEREEMENNSKYILLGPSNRGYSSLDNVIEAIIKSLFITSNEKKKLDCYYELLHKIKYRRAIGLIINIDKLREIPRIIKNPNYRRPHNINMDRLVELYEEINGRLKELNKICRHLFPNYRGRGFAIAVEHFSHELFELYRELLSLDAIGPFIKDIIFESESGNPVLLSEMSSGEITMLFRFLPLVMEIEDNSIILIDEPETHLHPRWTREFISYLTSLFSDYKVHVLIATHSPAIASDVPMKCIVGLRNQEGRIQQYKPKDRTLGGHSSQMLQDVFELKDLSSLSALKIINQITKLLDRPRPNSKQIDEARQLYNDLSTTTEKYRLYQKYKKFLGE